MKDVRGCNTQQLVNILRNQIFAEVKNSKLIGKKSKIIAYFAEEKIDGKKIYQMSVEYLTDELVDHCKLDKSLAGPIADLRKRLIEYKPIPSQQSSTEAVIDAKSQESKVITKYVLTL